MCSLTIELGSVTKELETINLDKVCMCVCIVYSMYVCMYVCMYACMHACIYICLHKGAGDPCIWYVGMYV